jgi:hypothetical protein
MATKKSLAEQVMRVVSGGHLKPDRTIDIREVMLYIDQLRDEAARVSVYNNLREGRYEVDPSFLTEYENVAIALDTSTELYYSTLTARPLGLPHGLGLYSVSPQTNLVGTFKIIRNGSIGIYGEMPSFDTELNTWCWWIGDKLYYKNLDPTLTDVYIQMVATSSSLTESDDFPMPPDIESLVIQNAVKMFGVMQQVPHDEIEDGNK